MAEPASWSLTALRYEAAMSSSGSGTPSWLEPPASWCEFRFLIDSFERSCSKFNDYGFEFSARSPSLPPAALCSHFGLSALCAGASYLG